MTADWYRCRVGEVCGACGVRQVATAPMRRLRSTGVRCADCAKRLLGEDVPSHLRDAVPPPLPRFERPLQMLTPAELALAARPEKFFPKPKPKGRDR